MALSGAASLGTARGSIQIDTRDLTNVQAVARSVGQDVARSLGAIDASAKRTQSSIAQFTAGIRSLRGEIVAIGLGAGLLTGLGLKMAGNLEEAKIQLTGMLKNETKAVALMDELRKSAAKAGVPFADMLQSARQFLPTLEGNTEQLEKYLQLARRVATLRPSEGIAGAAFAINEALTTGGTDLISLAERFNISKVRFRDALKETGGDFAAALDLVLTRMGITNETADKMGKTFNASLRLARDAAVQLLGEGFTPLLQTLTPLLQRGAEWLAQLRQTSPEIANWGAGLTAFVAVGAPTLLFLGRMIELLQRLKGLRNALVLGGAAVAGAEIGLGLSNAISRARGQPEQDWGDIAAEVKKLFFIVQNVWERAVKSVAQAIISSGAWVTNAFAGIVEGLARIMRTIGESLPGWAGGEGMKHDAYMLEISAFRARQTAATAPAINESIEQDYAQRQRNRINQFGLSAGGGTAVEGATSAMVQQQAAVNQERIAAELDYMHTIASIESDAANQRISATRQYEQQRSEVIAQYELSIARDAEDFARQRARQQVQLQSQIAGIRQDASEREAAWNVDLADRIAEIRSEGSERLSDIEENYQRDRERRERDHRDRLFDAAARLDAVAVANEQRNYARQSADADEQHDEQVGKEQENIVERIAQEQEGHQERLEEARKADEERIADMITAQAEQQRLEDEDRAIRLQRQAEDHATQLASMDAAHSEQMAEIDRQEAAELKSARETHIAQMVALGLHYTAWEKIQKDAQEKSLKDWQKFWDDLTKTQRMRITGGTGNGPSNPMNPMPIYASGGWVGQTGPIMAHAGEYVLNRQQAMAMAGGGGSTLNISEGAIVVYASPGQSETGIARAVRIELEELFKELAA